MSDQAEADVTIRHAEPDHLAREHGLDLRLLHPWPELADTPFRGAWCVLRPGDVTDLHDHRERELFIVMSGRGAVVADGTPTQLAAGDLALIKAGVQHRVTNEHDEDFAYYAVWWDRLMAADYLGSQDPVQVSRPDAAPDPVPVAVPVAVRVPAPEPGQGAAEAVGSA